MKNGCFFFFNLLLSQYRLVMTLHGLLVEPCVSHLNTADCIFPCFSINLLLCHTCSHQVAEKLFNWKNKWYHVSSASPELCYDQGCQLEQWYAWLLIDSIIWLHSVRLPLWKMFQSGSCFHRCGYRLSDSTLTKNRASE